MTRSLFAKSALIAAVSGLVMAAGTAPAQAEIEWLLNARLRAETVDMDGVANSADAVTLRTRFGFQTGDLDGFSILIEGENVAHIVDDFNDTINGLPGHPVIADPETTELNRAQVSFTGIQHTSITVGRQRVILGDARYVGNVGFRQNEQTFDALVISNSGLDNVTFTYAYFDRVHRIFGDDHPAGELDLDLHAVNVGLDTDFGQFTGFAYLADVQDAAAISNSTFGVNWRGSIENDGAPTFNYMLEYANQTEYGNSTGDFDLDMFRGEFGFSDNGLSGAIGFESLEGDGTRGFSTPLATLHKFQGWADVFLGTPANGIRDVYGRVGFNFPEAPFGEALNIGFVYHDFQTQSGDIDLGTELDAVVTSRISEHVSLQLKAAFFEGSTSGPASRDKIWFAVTYQR
jgi:hypothetical protein